MKKKIYFPIFIIILINCSCRIPPVILEIDNSEHPEAVDFKFDTTENNEAVSLVLSEKSNFAVVSWWGYNEEDSTEILQSAINSGVNVLYVPNMGTPWITEPLFLESNQEIIFESGCIIKAKKGSFQGGGDALFSIKDKENVILKGYGAVFEMRKEDYMGAEYSDAQWRHTLQIRGCKNIQVLGLEMRKSGGDGIYIGTGSKEQEGNINYCKDIYIKDVILNDHYRQGISIISAENILIENCIIVNTYGHSPEAGIDFEPNNSSERLINCTVKNCEITNNSGSGVMVYITQFDNNTLPVSIVLDSNNLLGNKRSLLIAGMSSQPHGEILIRNNQISLYNRIVESEFIDIVFVENSKLK